MSGQELIDYIVVYLKENNRPPTDAAIMNVLRTTLDIEAFKLLIKK